MSEGLLASTPRVLTPTGWSWRRLGDLASEVAERAGGVEYSVLSVTKHRGIVRAEDYFKKAVHGRETSNYKVVRRGQFAYATIHLDEGSIGCLRDDDAGIVSPMYTVFDLRDGIEREYLLRVLKQPESLATYRTLAQGTVNRRASIGFTSLASLYALIPPLAEQRKIAAILSSVDDAIEASQAVIDQLQVVKKAMMAELLTKGLPGRHKKFKQTEIGQVPEEWEVAALGDLLSSGPDNGLYKHLSAYGDGVRIVRIDAFSNGEIVAEDELRRVRIDDTETERFRLATDDILINRVNSLSHLGKVGFVQTLSEPAVFESNMMRLTVNKAKVLPEFAFAELASERAREHFLSRAKQAVAQASINQQDVKCFPILLPGLTEQHAIVEALGTISRRMHHEAESLNALVNTKSALMSVLLTGEVHVRVDEDAAA